MKSGEAFGGVVGSAMPRGNRRSRVAYGSRGPCITSGALLPLLSAKLQVKESCVEFILLSINMPPTRTMKCSPLEESMRTILSKRKTNSTFRALNLPPTNSIDFSSNDFLSLSKSSLLKTAFLQELESSPDFRLGSGGSRLLDGNSAYAEQLEQDITAFHGAPSGLLFNSGFDANSGFFSCVPQPGDLVVHDEHIHASVHEGLRLSRAGARVSFAHNSLEDLRRILLQYIQQDQLIQVGQRSVFVAIESLYSMDGDLAPIKEIVELVEELLPSGNGHIVVDEAHSNGVYGPQGRGIVCKLGLEDRISARLHTFGKGLACNGGMFSLSHYMECTKKE